MPKPTFFQTLTGAPSRSYSGPNDHHSQFVNSSRPASLYLTSSNASSEIERRDRHGRRGSFRDLEGSGWAGPRSYQGPRSPGSTLSEGAVSSTRRVFDVPARWSIASSGGMDLGPSLHREPSRRYAASDSSSPGRRRSISSTHTASTSRGTKHLQEPWSKSSNVYLSKRPLPQPPQEVQARRPSQESQPTAPRSLARSHGPTQPLSPATAWDESRTHSSDSLGVSDSLYQVGLLLLLCRTSC
jgi:hypothetical protein